MSTDSIVILLLSILPIVGSAGLDRIEVARLAGCPSGTALISITEDPGRGWIVIVRCRVPVVPIAEILRTYPYEAPRQPPQPVIGS